MWLFFWQLRENQNQNQNKAKIFINFYKNNFKKWFEIIVSFICAKECKMSIWRAYPGYFGVIILLQNLVKMVESFAKSWKVKSQEHETTLNMAEIFQIVKVHQEFNQKIVECWLDCFKSKPKYSKVLQRVGMWKAKNMNQHWIWRKYFKVSNVGLFSKVSLNIKIVFSNLLSINICS